MARLPIEGIRVIDSGDILAGPFGCEVLGDLGAEVIRVESIQRLSGWRGLLSPPPIKPAAMDAFRWAYPDGVPGERPYNRHASFNGTNRNKLGITLNLKDPSGVELFKRLVAICDILIENYATGTLEKLGLGYKVLSEINPGIIVISMPLLGNTGPYKDYRGMGPDLDAMSGHVSMRGYPDGDPAEIQTHAHTDSVSGVTAAFAALAAVNYRQRTGKGQFIDVSEYETFLPHMGEAFMEYTMNGRVRGPMGNAHASIALQGCYPCKGEDSWVTIAVPNDEVWRRFCHALGDPAWTEDERFAGVLSRLQNQAELNSHIEDWTSQWDHYEVFDTLQQARVPVGPVLKTEEVFNDPHLRERGFFEEKTHKEAGTHFYPAPTWKFSKTPLSIRLPANCLGEHNSQILGGLLGLSEGEIVELEKNQVIGTEFLPTADQ